MAHLTREPKTSSAMARASARLAMRLPLLAGTGTSQHGPSMRAAIRGAAIWMAAAVGIFKSREMCRAMISSGLGVRQPMGTYLVACIVIRELRGDGLS